jgi:hypothetical protein
MHPTLRGMKRPQQAGGHEPPRLPLRWAFILLVAALAGFTTTQAAGGVAGATLAISAVGVLHKILP